MLDVEVCCIVMKLREKCQEKNCQDYRERKPCPMFCSHYVGRENNSIELKVLFILVVFYLSSYRCLTPFHWE